MFGIEYPAPYISFILIFLGMLMRAVYPYIQKYKDFNGDAKADFKWDHRYTFTLLSNLALCFIATMLFFNTWSPPEGELFQVAIASFIAGWGSQDFINRLVK